MAILCGNPGIGKTMHAIAYCSYIIKMPDKKIIVRWINSNEKEKINQELQLCIRETGENLNLTYLDKVSRHLFYLIETYMKNEKILFVFDNLENFDLIDLFFNKLNELVNVQILITTNNNDYSNKYIIKYINDDFPRWNYQDLPFHFQIDFFNDAQAQLFMEKSIKKYLENKDEIIKEILESETRNGCFLPHRLNYIVEYINNSKYKINEYLKSICDKSIWDKNDIYFKYFEMIEKENDISMKILYFFSLMDPDEVLFNLIKDLLPEHTIQEADEATDLLMKKGLIEVWEYGNGVNFYRIHRLTQEIIKLFRKKKERENHFIFENKLLSVLNDKFKVTADFSYFLSKSASEDIILHVKSLLKLNKDIFTNKIEYLELNFNFGVHSNIFHGYGDGESIINECLKHVNKLNDTDLRVKILYHLAHNFETEENGFQQALNYFNQVLELSRNSANACDIMNLIAMFRLANLYRKKNLDEALEKAEELFKKAEELLKVIPKLEYERAKFLSLSLIITIKCSLNRVTEADNYLDHFIQSYKNVKLNIMLHSFLNVEISLGRGEMALEFNNDNPIQNLRNCLILKNFYYQIFENAATLYIESRTELLDSTEHAEAEQILDKMLKISKICDEKKDLEFYVSLSLGRFHFRKNENEIAKQYYEESLKLLEKIDIKTQHKNGVVLAELAFVWRNLKDEKKALEFLLNSLLNFTVDSLDKADLLTHVSISYKTLSETKIYEEKKERLIKRAQENQKKASEMRARVKMSQDNR
jgi:hypothetical protein